MAILPALAQNKQPTEAERAEHRKKAEELRARHAREREEVQKGLSAVTSAARPDSSPAPKLGNAQICKATIGALMGRDPSTVRVINESADIVFIEYVRPTDSSTWQNKCRVDGGKIVWATASGRWRNGADDEKISYRFEPSGQVVIRIGSSDGSASEKKYPIEGL